HQSLHAFPTRRSSDLVPDGELIGMADHLLLEAIGDRLLDLLPLELPELIRSGRIPHVSLLAPHGPRTGLFQNLVVCPHPETPPRSEEHTSELQSRFDL